MTRLEYRHVANGQRYNPRLFGQVLNEAINLFEKRKRIHNGYEIHYGEGHPLSLVDIREIGSYIDRIWNDEEIYVDMEENS